LDLPVFSKTYDAIRSRKKLDYLFTAEAVFSYPVGVRREDRFYDGVFAYYHQDGRDTAARPHAWALFSMDTGNLCLLSECAAADFINPVQYPLDTAVSMALPRSMDNRKIKALQKDLIAAYDNLRQFAFEENLNRDQVAVVVRYKDLFMQLCPKGLYPFYHALSPAFFHWLRLPLPENGPPALTQDTPEEDTRVYEHQLLILENLQQLVRQFQEKIAVDSHKDMLFDHLHKEVQDYKNDLLDSLTRHMELDVIQLIDSLAKTLDSFRDKPCSEADYARLYKMLAGVETDLRDILYRQGVDPFTVAGEDADPTRQNTVSTVPTSNTALDKKIAARMAPGWTKNGKVIRPERVSVYIAGESGGR
jgi:molecular chaperone GrpE (heat shock protein)